MDCLYREVFDSISSFKFALRYPILIFRINCPLQLQHPIRADVFLKVCCGEFAYNLLSNREIRLNLARIS
jgi:hypothetical protein